MTNFANVQEHVPETERNNHILKEHIHTTYHGIPYKMIPQTVICYMVMKNAAKLNCFPTKGGCSKYFSLSEILHHVKLDYTKHCYVPLLSYILIHNEQTLTKTVHMHLLDFLSYVLFKPRKVGMNDIIFTLTRSLHDHMSLSFPQPLL